MEEVKELILIVIMMVCFFGLIFLWDYAFAYAICYYQNVVLSISLAVLIGLLIFGNAATRVIVLIIVALSLISSLFNIKPTSMEMAEKAVSCKK